MFKDIEVRSEVERLKKIVGTRPMTILSFSAYFDSFMGMEPAKKEPTLFQEIDALKEKIDLLAAHIGVELYKEAPREAKLAIRSIKKTKQK